jgi:predicted transcriptional regulator
LVPGTSPRTALQPIFGHMSSPIQQSPVPVETPAEREERLAWEAQAIKEALQSIEEEGTIPFEEIVAWVKSWDTQDELPPPEPRK